MRKTEKKNIKIKDILKGKFLVEENSAKSWYFILYLIFLGFLMITSAHLIDKKIVRLTKLNDEVSLLKSKYANIQENLASKLNRNYIETKAKEDSLLDVYNQPYLIVDKPND